MASNYLERALFVIGDQGDGKSSQIRDIFRDKRFHHHGKSRIGDDGRLDDWIAISNERWLHVRVTSPHEYGEDIDTFLKKIEDKNDSKSHYRWNFLGALQASEFRKMPHPEEAIRHFIKIFTPERVRAVLIVRTYEGEAIESHVMYRILDGLKDSICEVVLIDAQRDNGLMIADFFDFT